MYITRLPPGHWATDNADQVHIRRLSDGQATWSGSVEANGRHVFGSSRSAASAFEDAEAEAITWAGGHSVMDLQIETDDA